MLNKIAILLSLQSFLVSNAMAKSELTCAGTIEKLSISSDTLSARVFFYDSEGPGKSSFIKICSFSSNKGNISPAACASLYSDLKDKVSRNRIEFSFKKAKECSDLNGLWIESISL